MKHNNNHYCLQKRKTFTYKEHTIQLKVIDTPGKLSHFFHVKVCNFPHFVLFVLFLHYTFLNQCWSMNFFSVLNISLCQTGKDTPIIYDPICIASEIFNKFVNVLEKGFMFLY